MPAGKRGDRTPPIVHPVFGLAAVSNLALSPPALQSEEHRGRSTAFPASSPLRSAGTPPHHFGATPEASRAKQFSTYQEINK